MHRVTILELEGLVMNGLIDDFKIIDCEVDKKKRYSKIVAKLRTGENVETQCLEYPRISRIYLVLVKYKDWGKTLVSEEITPEMMSGITYDLDLGKNEG